MVSFTSLTSAFGGAIEPAEVSVFARGPCQAVAVCTKSDKRTDRKKNVSQARRMRPPQQGRLSTTKGRVPGETRVAYAILFSTYYRGQALLLVYWSQEGKDLLIKNISYLPFNFASKCGVLITGQQWTKRGEFWGKLFGVLVRIVCGYHEERK